MLIVFNNYQGPNKYLINLFIIIMRQYIYAKKCFNEVPIFTGFVEKLSYWFQIDKQIALENHKLAKCIAKWKNIF